VLVRVLLQLAHTHGQLVGLLEDDRLHKLLLLLETCLKVGVELVYLPVDFVLEFVEVLLDGGESALDVLAVLLSVLQVIT
jgi:hypothetical protein